MSTLDIVMIVILTVFAYNGLAKGIIRLVGKLAGLVVGAFIASHSYLWLYQLALKSTWIQTRLDGRAGLGQTAAFIIAFVAVTWLVDLLFASLEKLFDLIAFIPGSKYLNNIAGAALGLLEGALFLGLIVFVASHYDFLLDAFGGQLRHSFVRPYLLDVVNVVLPVLPSAWKTAKAWF